MTVIVFFIFIATHDYIFIASHIDERSNSRGGVLWMGFPILWATTNFLFIVLHSGFVYILTNAHHTVLYVGVTNDLYTRVCEHRTKLNRKSFTARYNVYKLVYYESFETILEAIAREKYIKGKTRKWKEALISSMNPDWMDLFSSLVR